METFGYLEIFNFEIFNFEIFNCEIFNFEIFNFVNSTPRPASGHKVTSNQNNKWCIDDLMLLW